MAKDSRRHTTRIKVSKENHPILANKTIKTPTDQPPQQSYARPQQNFQAQPTATAPTQRQGSRTDELLQQILPVQQRLDNMHNHVNVKLDGITNHVGTLKRNLEAITLHVRKLETQVDQIAEAVKHSTEERPGKPEPNPSGREYVNSVVQNHGEISTQCNMLKAHNLNPGEENVAVSTAAFENFTIARETSSSRGGEISSTSEGSTQIDQLQSITYDRVRHFRETVCLIPRNTAFEEACASYSLQEVFRGTFLTKEEIGKTYAMARIDNYPHTLMKWIKKKNDPGKFSLSCTIFNEEFSDCMCDTRSCINVIQKVAAERLGLTNYQVSNVSLSLANTSTISPLGKIHAIPVRIGNHIVPTDFHVVDTRGDHSASIIRRRSFLATVGAVIDLPRKRVTFTNIGRFCIYPAVPTEYSAHEVALDSNPKRKPKSWRKGDYKGKKAETKANKGIVVKGLDIKVQGGVVDFAVVAWRTLYQKVTPAEQP